MRISDWSSDVCSSDLPDREQPHPIAPDPPDDLFRHVTPRSVRVLPGTEEQFGAIDVADAAHHRLIHQQDADRGGLAPYGSDEPLFAGIRTINEGVRTELGASRAPHLRRLQAARVRPNQAGPRPPLSHPA